MMKIGRTVVGILVGLILVGSVVLVTLQQQASAFGFVERQQIGNFQKLTGEFLQNPTSGQPSQDVAQSRELVAQFEREIINAVLNDHTFLIPAIVDKWNNPVPGRPLPGGMNWDDYFDNTLSIFCRPCI
jgi:hypothetical protein